MNKTIEERYHDLFLLMMQGMGITFDVDKMFQQTIIIPTNAEILKNGLLYSFCGKGPSMFEAQQDFVNNLKDNTIVVDANKSYRREIYLKF